MGLLRAYSEIVVLPWIMSMTKVALRLAVQRLRSSFISLLISNSSIIITWAEFHLVITAICKMLLNWFCTHGAHQEHTNRLPLALGLPWSGCQWVLIVVLENSLTLWLKILLLISIIYSRELPWTLVSIWRRYWGLWTILYSYFHNVCSHECKNWKIGTDQFIQTNGNYSFYTHFEWANNNISVSTI